MNYLEAVAKAQSLRDVCFFVTPMAEKSTSDAEPPPDAPGNLYCYLKLWNGRINKENKVCIYCNSGITCPEGIDRNRLLNALGE